MLNIFSHVSLSSFCCLWWSVYSCLFRPFSKQIFFKLLSFQSSSYVTDISPLADMSGTLHSVALKSNEFCFDEVQFIIFPFLDHAFDMVKIIHWVLDSRFSFYSSKSIVLYCTFKRMLHFVSFYRRWEI